MPALASKQFFFRPPTGIQDRHFRTCVKYRLVFLSAVFSPNRITVEFRLRLFFNYVDDSLRFGYTPVKSCSSICMLICPCNSANWSRWLVNLFLSVEMHCNFLRTSRSLVVDINRKHFVCMPLSVVSQEIQESHMKVSVK
jgi:hypothetical protein